MNVKPIFRIFDYKKTKEFYVDWLGVKILGEHKFCENCPLYIRVSLGDLELHLSEHHGDCSPGARVLVEDFPNLEAFHKSLIAKDYKYNKPGLERAFWDKELITMQVTDPFGNKITFTERKP